ncbi:MAG: hypothetical protein ABJX32_04190 [Tateyamaria sp.]|uniref:hypothetical protein n=1 Tax=Tateyamaria sp. TaxID=1929288 RepID=UPI00329D9DA2
MIIANLATYPPRRASLIDVVNRIAPQVDQLNIVLNQYEEVPAELEGQQNVNPILPEEDTKDVGKFYPKSEGTYTFLIDDDLVYPPDFVQLSIERFEQIAQPRAIGGYHTSTYRLPRPWRGMGEMKRLLAFRWRIVADYRAINIFYQHLGQHKGVDQVATNSCILRSADMPSYEYMRDSQKFVDVRLARWCYDQGIQPVALPREKDWLTPIRYDETIHGDFTRTNPTHVSEEIRTFAFKVPGRNRLPALKGN